MKVTRVASPEGIPIHLNTIALRKAKIAILAFLSAIRLRDGM